MSRPASMITRLTVVLTAVAMVLAALVAVSVAPPGRAAPSPVEPRGSGIVSADALPTVQINGVVWSQAVVGDTVYAGGSFSHARPAGAPAGTNETARGNLLAYDIATGDLATGFPPALNGQVLAVEASPDGSRVYVGGDFTTADGQSRSRIAAYSTATGQLISSFAPPVGSQVAAIAATDDTVYVGGSMRSVGNQERSFLAAFNASNGSLLGWAPVADLPVKALTLTADGRHVIAGGHFETVNGSPARGLAKIDAATGALVPWPVPISNAGTEAAVTSLSTDGGAIYGTAYHFGPGGNMEGPWSVDADTGALRWVADCHGDTYSNHVAGDAVYIVGHPHYCGNVGGGFPQYSDWRFQHSMAFTKDATGDTLREPHGYANWAGEPSPSIIHWLPTMSIGSFTGQYQAGWSVTGNGDYVVVGGEFPRVNGTPQQGLVRFASGPDAPGERGPAFVDNQLVPDLAPAGPGAVRVSWLAGYDQDDLSLNYQVVRTPGGVVHTLDADSSWWHVPVLDYVDTGLTPGATYSYQLRATDGSGNRVFGVTRSMTAPTTVERNAYATQVLEDGASLYWPMSEGTGNFLDRAGGNHGIPGASITRGVPGAVEGDPAVTLAGTNDSRTHARGTQFAPTEMTSEVWIRTTAGSGRVLGFSDIPTGNSGHRDRQIYMNDNGRVSFGVRGGGAQVVTSEQRYNDDQWHHVVATLEGGTATLYVDGVRVGQRSDIVDPEVYIGQWRLGGDRQSGWPSAGSSNFAGSVDEIAVYPRALTGDEVMEHFLAGGGEGANTAPTAAFTHAATDLQVDLDGTGSSDPDGTLTAYSWDFGDGNEAAGPTTSHTYDSGGTYEVTLTVTDDDGATDSVTTAVTVTQPPPNQAPEAAFEATVTDLQVAVDASGSRDPDGDISAYTWDFGDGSTATDPVTTHTYATAGTYPVTLTVTDDDGANSTTTQEVTVVASPTNEAPIAAFTVSPSDLTVTVDGTTSTDTDGDVMSYAWSFGDGTTADTATATHTYAAAGTYDVTLTVTDDDGATGEHTEQVTVTAPPVNSPPTADFSVSTAGLSATLDGEASIDPDGSIASYAWNLGDGASSDQASVVHEYAESGSYEVTLTVTDDQGATDSQTQTVTVAKSPAPPPEDDVRRLQGAKRYQTAAVIAREYPAGVEVAYVATGRDFPDALSGAALAGMTDGPMLLTKRTELPPVIAAELQRLSPNRIVVLGGDEVVTEDVIDALRAYTPDVQRLEGTNRYGTSADVAGEYPADVEVAYVATGEDFPDALSAAALAGATDGPMLLTRVGALPEVIKPELERLSPQRIVILGGSKVVSEDVLNELRAYAPDVERLAGGNRYGTAAKVAERYPDNIAVAYVATGQDFPDALSGAALAGATDGPMLLTRVGALPEVIKPELERLAPDEAIVLGGEGVVSDDVERALGQYTR